MTPYPPPPSLSAFGEGDEYAHLGALSVVVKRRKASPQGSCLEDTNGANALITERFDMNY